jgi:PASTA domain
MMRRMQPLGALVGVLLVSLFASASAPAASPLTWAVTPAGTGSPLGSLNGFESISCPSESLCVGTDWNAQMISSTNPTGGPDAWKVVFVGGGGNVSALIVDVSCPSDSLCVAFSDNGYVLTSTNPTGGADAWSIALVGGGGVRSVSCASVSLCVAVDESGNVITSTNPTGGSGAWTVTQLSGIEDRLYGVSCVPGPQCVVSSIESGEVATSTNPTGGAGAWSAYSLNPEEVTTRISDLSCPSASLCVAVGDKQLSGTEFIPIVLTSTNPTGGAGTWNVTGATGENYMFAVSCPTTPFCVAGGEFRHMLTTDNPAGGAGAWSPFQIDPPGGGLTPPSIKAMSCASASLCVAGDEHGNAIVGAPAASPVNNGQPVASGTPDVGQVLTCGRGAWSGHPFPTFTYRWQRDGVDIGGAVGATYTVQSSDQGHTLTCVVTATNGSSQAEASSTGVPVASPAKEPSGGGGSSSGAGSGSTSQPLPGGAARCTVPYLKGKTLGAAKRVLKRSDCQIGTVSRPKTKQAKSTKRKKRLTVRGQSPNPGLTKPAGTKVSIRLG